MGSTHLMFLIGNRVMPRRRLRGVIAGLAVAGVAVLPASGAVGATLQPKLVANAGYGSSPVSFARSADGTLHLAIESNINWGDSFNGVAARSITPAGTLGPSVTALSWGGSGGSPSGIPGLAVLPGGTLDAVFGGSPGGDPGPWSITSSNGGSTWTTPADVGSGSMEGGGALTLQLSNGTPVITEGCCGGLVVQKGFGAGAPTFQLVNSTDGVAGDVNTALDASTGAPVASWVSVAGTGGSWLQQIAPSEGAAQKAPIPSQYGEGVPLIAAGRDSGPGVFAAYPANYANTTHISLLRYGVGSVSVGSVKGLHANVWGTATGKDGRIWVAWWGQKQSDGKEYLVITRSNKAVTRFEPLQLHQFRFNLGVLQGDGRLGPLDMLIIGTPYGGSLDGIYYARILPELSAKVKASDLGGGKFKLKFAVSDAGDAVGGATASAKGLHAKTKPNGHAKLEVSGHAGQRVTVTVTAPGYQELKETITL